jgi:hypothetical protein
MCQNRIKLLCLWILCIWDIVFASEVRSEKLFRRVVQLSKATVIFLIPTRPSVRPYACKISSSKGTFIELLRQISNSLKSIQKQTLYMNTCTAYSNACSSEVRMKSSVSTATTEVLPSRLAAEFIKHNTSAHMCARNVTSYAYFLSR